jgi:hypothetical protein
LVLKFVFSDQLFSFFTSVINLCKRKLDTGTTVKEDGMDGACSTHGTLKNAYKILDGRPKWKRPVGRSRRRWEGNIRMDLTERGWEGVDWILLAQDRDQWWAVVNTVMNLRIL